MANYGGGGDSLHQLEMRNLFSSLARKKASGGRDILGTKSRARQQMPGQMGMGFTVRPTETISSTLPTAGESMAFQERKKNRALYGQYGKGGLERARLNAEVLSKREGLRSAEKIAGIGAGATTGTAGIRGKTARDVADIQGVTSRDVAGIDARSALATNAAADRLKKEELRVRFGPEGVERIKATKPQYKYLPEKDAFGEPISYQAFKDGQRMNIQPTVKKPTVKKPTKWNKKNLKWWDSLPADQRQLFLDEANRRRSQ